MAVIKSFSVGHGDMFYIRHASDNFTIIDCCLPGDRLDEILDEIEAEADEKGIVRFISTHPDEDHIAGLADLDERIAIRNFYCVQNQAIKAYSTTSFDHYCSLRDHSTRAYHVFKGCKRKWMNRSDDKRGGAGLQVLWPDRSNEEFKAALEDAELGIAFNNISLVVRYSIEGGPSFMWIGDLETDFMEAISDDIALEKTTIVFAPHHGRKSGKIPASWLEKLDPQIIVIGEAPSRHLNYYTGYQTITQNKAGDIIFDTDTDKVHIYASNENYGPRFDVFDDEGEAKYDFYIGSITVETEYTLDG